ncbi:hypothetical protein FE257_013037 [Aspergillus nanangensis]|uniref:Uncharacterized protein n=1 Tax=Aspergillus nanangensis TaxID=2582783 RepID=A0AAD4CF14_ASPNN|nr:hypothetical protein FE257_013037 [Aspergillus nanangensis]
MASKYNSVHIDRPIPNLDAAFELSCAAGTDIWDKAPSTHTFNAPIVYQRTTKEQFMSSRLTVSADFKDRFDQAGLCLVIKSADRTRWIKTGIEVEFDVPWVSTVVKDEWADWSLRDLFDGSKKQVTVEIRKEDDGDLWVHAFGPDGRHAALRQITWWSALPDDIELWVGPYVAKPAPNGETERFTAHFDGFEVKTL